jgi:uncharacterized protein (DUF305 family)
MTVTPATSTDAGSGGAAPSGGRLTKTFVLIIAAGAVVLLLVGGTLGLALSGSIGNSAPANPDTTSVDAGFARDMIVHHDQGVLMAHYAEQNTTDQEIGVMAYDINYTQTDQIGQMQGWLALWDLPEFSNDPHMAWMQGADGGHGGMDMGGSTTDAAGTATAGSGTAGAEVSLMPGMATASEIATLQSLSGVESDIYFLQLMVRHHQGGAPMMTYAAEYATNPVVRNFASKMADAQTSEISVMTQMLAERGAQPLPAPAG